MEQLKFSNNWNGKLFCDAFTTLRLHDPAKFFVGNEFQCLLNKAELGLVKVVEVRTIYLHQLNEFICYLDTGLNTAKTMEVIKEMYKKYTIDWTTQKLDFVLLLYIQKSETSNKVKLFLDTYLDIFKVKYKKTVKEVGMLMGVDFTKEELVFFFKANEFPLKDDKSIGNFVKNIKNGEIQRKMATKTVPPVVYKTTAKTLCENEKQEIMEDYQKYFERRENPQRLNRSVGVASVLATVVPMSQIDKRISMPLAVFQKDWKEYCATMKVEMTLEDFAKKFQFEISGEMVYRTKQ
jgi:hypothetical protein